jgi:hypothetical protein
MYRTIIFFLTFFLTLAVGITASGFVGKTRAVRVEDHRSCQVKLVKENGHAVWMPCSEWKTRSENGELAQD